MLECTRCGAQEEVVEDAGLPEGWDTFLLRAETLLCPACVERALEKPGGVTVAQVVQALDNLDAVGE